MPGLVREKLGEHREGKNPTGDGEAEPDSLAESTQRIAESASPRRSELRYGGGGSRERHGRRSSRQKGVRITLGQKLESPPADLRVDVHQLGVQLPRLDLHACRRRPLERLHRIADRPKIRRGPGGRLNRSREGHDTHSGAHSLGS